MTRTNAGILILAAVGICSCNKTVETRLVSAIQRHLLNGDTCVVKMVEATDFKWDKMYYFPPSATQEEIEHELGIKLSNYKCCSTMLAFKNAGALVHLEKHEYEPSDVADGTVYFKDATGMDVRREYTAETAVFFVRQVRSRKACFYELAQMRQGQ